MCPKYFAGPDTLRNTLTQAQGRADLYMNKKILERSRDFLAVPNGREPVLYLEIVVDDAPELAEQG